MLASAIYTGEWQSERTLVGTIAIPGVKQKVRTSVTFDRDHQLIQISVDDRSLVILK
jgi:hypothetical protein